jgi:hypothetical protein
MTEQQQALAIAIQALNRIKEDCQKEHCHCGCFEVEQAIQKITSLTSNDR